jgi:hypothetical protein
MYMAIQLPPSSDFNALADAIHKATISGEPLVLLPGVHLTKPGIQPLTPIGPKGLVMGSAPIPLVTAATIQRPSFSVGNNPQHATDDNYGILFIPAQPGNAETETLQFTFHPPTPPVNIGFEFAIIQQGDIEIGDINLDCNMGQQKLKLGSAPHSFMWGFSGASYRVNPGPNGLERRVFVAFNSVTLRNIRLLNGGFADDLRLEPGFAPNAPGFFRPNIGRVDLAGITMGGPRFNGEGNSVRFGGLAQQVAVENCNLDSLILEFDEDWSTFPGPPGPFQPSLWNVAGVTARTISFNAVGPVQTLNATDLDAGGSFTVSNAAGHVSGSRLTLLPNDVQLANLRQLLFQNCVFTLPQKAGVVNGIDLVTKPGKSLSVRFQGCQFTTADAVQTGHLILSEHTNDPANQVTADFEKCRYEPAFTKNANIFVANLGLRGDYTFLKEDFAGLDIAKAIHLSQPGQVIDQGATVRVHIP